MIVPTRIAQLHPVFVSLSQLHTTVVVLGYVVPGTYMTTVDSVAACVYIYLWLFGISSRRTTKYKAHQTIILHLYAVLVVLYYSTMLFHQQYL